MKTNGAALWKRLVGRFAAGEDDFYRLCIADTRRAYRLGLVVLCALVAFTIALLVFTGPSPQQTNPNDAMLLLDAGWRVTCGQRPQVDFSYPMGLTSLLPIVLGMAVTGCHCAAFAYGPALLLPPLALGTWWLARRRLSALAATWVSAMIGLLVAGAFPLGFNTGWRMTSYAMQYNRLNWPLLLMLALAVLIEPRQRLTRPVAILEGAAAGAVTALLCAGKINFAVAAFAILFLAWLVRRHGAAFWLSFSAVLAALMGLYLFYLRGDIAAYCQDLAMLRRLHPFPTVARTLLGILLASIPEFCGLALIIFVQLRSVLSARRSTAAAQSWLASVALALVLVGVGVEVAVGTGQQYDIPLCPLAAIVMIEAFQRLPRPSNALGEGQAALDGGAQRLRLSVSHLVAMAAGLAFIAADFGSLAYAAAWTKGHSPRRLAAAQIHSPVMQGMLFPPHVSEAGRPDDVRSRTDERLGGLTPIAYAAWINDGLALLRHANGADACIYTLDWCNPFPALLRSPSPKGVVLCAPGPASG